MKKIKKYRKEKNMKTFVKQNSKIIEGLYPLPENIEEVLLRAEKQIETGETMDARDFFEELEKEYGIL